MKKILNFFENLSDRIGLPTYAQLIYYKLFSIMVNSGASCGEEFEASNSCMLFKSGIKDESTFIRYRNILKQHGLIDFQGGKKKGCPTRYKLVFYDTTGFNPAQMPAQMPTQVPTQVPSKQPVYLEDNDIVVVKSKDIKNTTNFNNNSKAQKLISEMGKYNIKSELGNSFVDKYGFEEVNRHFANFKIQDKRKKIANPPGWLTRALKENFQYTSVVGRNKANSTCPKCQGEGYYPEDDNLSSMIRCDCWQEVNP